jgi:hypothetical protein
MASGDISIDQDATTANAHAHIQFAGELRQNINGRAAAMGSAVNTLGDLYADYKDAMNQQLIPAMVGAHYRLAALHEAHGRKGLQDVQAFTETDIAGAAGIAQDPAGAAPPNEIAT